MSEQAQGYPASDYDPRMVNAHRMRDVEAANHAKLSDMLATVLQRTLLNEEGNTSSSSSVDVATASSDVADIRFCGYHPEEIYRAVASFAILEKSDVLTKLLDAHVASYAREMHQRLLAFQASVVPNGTPSFCTASPASGEASGGDEEETGAEGAKKRRWLPQCSEASARCFTALVRVWRQLVNACDEIQCVWAPFANQYAASSDDEEAGKQRCGNTVTGPTAAWASALGSSLTYQRGVNNILLAALPALSEAVLSADNVLAAAVDGYVAVVLADVSASHPLPSASPPLPEDGDKQSTESAERAAAISSFTEFALAIGVYMPRVQPALVSAFKTWYADAAVQMYASEVSCGAFFRYAAEAIRMEKHRAHTLLHPHTGPMLVEAVERGLLGDVGIEVVSRDFANLFDAAAVKEDGNKSGNPPGTAADTGKVVSTAALVKENANEEADKNSKQNATDSLAFVWKLLSHCIHVPRDPVVRLFRQHIDEVGSDAVGTIVASVRAERPSTLQQQWQQRQQAVTRAAVFGLLDFVRRARLVIHRCFVPDEKIFSTQLHECLQRVLEPHQRVVVEVMATFVDGVFRLLETGKLRLAGGSTGGDTAPLTTTALLSSDSLGGDIDGGQKPCQNEEEEEEGGNDEVSDANSLRATTTTTQTGMHGSGNEILELVAFVCTHFPSMDTFEQLHWRDMGRRLLHPNRNVNFAAERCFLRIFEGICGNSFISKFEGMLRDMSTSETLTEQYKSWVSSEGSVPLAPPANTSSSSPPQGSSTDLLPVESLQFAALPKGVDVQLRFITDGLWPQCTPLTIQLPASMQRIVFNVEQFYHRLYAQRLVRWQHQLSHCVVKARLRPGAPLRQLSGTLVQCIMLLYLDERLTVADAGLSVAELCEGLGGLSLESPEVMGALLGLCNERFGLVLCERKTTSGAAGLGPQDTLRINSNFTCATAKAHIPFQIRVEKKLMGTTALDSAGNAITTTAAGGGGVSAAKGSKTEEETTLRNQGELIQVAIVQLMKKQGKAKHDELVQHLQTAKFHFTVTMPMVKKSLDRLIERGFIERKGADGYAYVA